MKNTPEKWSSTKEHPLKQKEVLITLGDIGYHDRIISTVYNNYNDQTT